MKCKNCGKPIEPIPASKAAQHKDRHLGYIHSGVLITHSLFCNDPKSSVYSIAELDPVENFNQLLDQYYAIQTTEE